MKTKNMLACESRQLEKLDFLPYRYKPIAFILLSLSLVGLIFLNFAKADFLLLKEIVKSLMLLSMLLVSVTKEKREDEYTLRQRAKSYIFALVVTVLYAIFQPYVDYGVRIFAKAPGGCIFGL